MKKGHFNGVICIPEHYYQKSLEVYHFIQNNKLKYLKKVLGNKYLG